MRITTLFVILGIVLLFLWGCSEMTSEPPKTVVTPYFNIDSGVYTEPQTVTITCETEGAEIRYTVDGSEPMAASTLYSEPLILTKATTLKAKAFKEKWEPSETAVLQLGVIATIEFEDLPVTAPLSSNTSITARALDEDGQPVSTYLTLSVSAGNTVFVSYDEELGWNQFLWNPGTVSQRVTITVSKGDLSEEAEIYVVPDPPASITLLPQYLEDDGNWNPLPEEGIPVEFEHDVRIETIVEDEYGNRVLSGQQIDYTTTLGMIEETAETNDEGLAYSSFIPGNNAGEALITATVTAEDISEDISITIYP